MEKRQFLSELTLVNEGLNDILQSFPEDLTKEDMEEVEAVTNILESLFDRVAQSVEE